MEERIVVPTVSRPASGSGARPPNSQNSVSPVSGYSAFLGARALANRPMPSNGRKTSAIIDVTPANKGNSTDFCPRLIAQESGVKKGLNFEGSTPGKNTASDTTTTSTAAKLVAEDGASLLEDLQGVEILHSQGKEWQTAFKSLLARQAQLDNFNKQKGQLYNQPMFISLLTEYNHANSKRIQDKPVLVDDNPQTVRLSVVRDFTRKGSYSIEPPNYDSILERNLNPIFSREGQPSGNIWAPLHDRKESMNLESLHLVKRPPDGQRTVLFKTRKNKVIPHNRIRSKKTSPQEKFEAPARRRGSFDLISTDEEFDEQEVYDLMIADGFRPEILQVLFDDR